MVKEEVQSKVELTQIPTGSVPGYLLPDSEEPVTTEGLLLWIAQQIWEIKKAVA